MSKHKIAHTKLEKPDNDLLLNTQSFLSFMYLPVTREEARQLCTIERLNICFEAQTQSFDAIIDRLVVACQKAQETETITKNILLINNRIFISNVLSTRSLRQGIFRLMSPFVQIAELEENPEPSKELIQKERKIRKRQEKKDLNGN